MGAGEATAALWLAVALSGLYHGLSPAMGWPLAVSAGLMERRQGALFAALAPLALGHALAMLVLVLPFALLLALVDWEVEVRLAAGLLVMAFGVYRLVDRRHPRALARIRPSQLGLWSFAIALAHGSGLMLVPLYLGLCRTQAALPASPMVAANLEVAVAVAVVHAAAMIAAGGLVAWLVYRYLGLRFLSRSWFDLDATWAWSLVAVGGLSVGLALAHAH